MPETVAEMTRNALMAAIQQAGETRLVSKGAKAPGLFPSGANKLKTEAINGCLTLGLLEKTREIEEGKGKAAKKSVFVRITPAGITALFEIFPLSKGREILSLIPPGNDDAAHAAFLKVAAAQVQKLQKELSILVAAESDAYAIARDFIAERLKFMAEAKKGLEAEIEDSEFAISPPAPSKVPVADRKVKSAASEEDLDFQRDQSEQLVFAWQDADPQAKESLENVMLNLGLQPLGERGQIIPFDGREHQTDEPVDVGDQVIVIDPGWRLSNSRGVYLISKAIVSKQGEK